MSSGNGSIRNADITFPSSTSAGITVFLDRLSNQYGDFEVVEHLAVRRVAFEQTGFDVPAILITGDTSHDELRRATDSGHPVLFKPVQPRKLLNALRGHIP